MFSARPCILPARRCALVLTALVLTGLLWPAPSAAAEPLTRARIAALARAAPASQVAASEVLVARAGADAAGVLSLENPVVSAMGGLRLNPDGTRPFAGVAAVSWPIDLGGQQSARAGAAAAELRAASAHAEDAGRRLLLEALLRHALVLRDERALALAAERRALAQRLVATAERRRAAGEVPELDLTLARLQAAREISAEAVAQGAREPCSTCSGFPRLDRRARES
jgi:cobalt-zinc-cadmium efflux system outer membrane protein